MKKSARNLLTIIKVQKPLLLLLFLLPLSLQAQEVGLAKTDSVIAKPVALADSLASPVSAVQGRQQQVQDSLARITALASQQPLQQKLDSLQQLASPADTLMLARTQDSLQQLKLPMEVYQAKEDSIRQALDLSAKLNKENSSLQKQLNKPLQEGQGNFQNKINQLTTPPEGMNKEALANLQEQSGLNISTDLPQVEGLSLGGIDLPANGLPEIKGIPANGLNGIELPEVPALTGFSLPEMEGIEAGKITEGIGSISELPDELQKAGEYKEDISRISKGKLNEVENADKLAEEQLMKREELDLLKQQQGMGKQELEEFQQYGQEGFLKQKANEEAAKVAIDHFKEHKGPLNAAREKLNKYKGRYQEVKSIKELPKNPLKRNPLRGKPWPERWVLGSIWQFHRQDQFKIDLAPSLVYRLTDKLEIGAAYQWRLTVDKKAPIFLSTNDWLSGYSLFTDYKIKKGFFIRGSVTRLNLVPLQAQVTDEDPSRVWVSSFMLGAGKSYTFYKSIKGYTVVQYSFSKGMDKPYKSPIQMKIGFYINGKHFYRKPKK